MQFREVHHANMLLLQEDAKLLARSVQEVAELVDETDAPGELADQIDRHVDGAVEYAEVRANQSTKEKSLQEAVRAKMVAC
jgi:hypothetical protein